MTAIAVFGSSQTDHDSELWRAGERCGRLLAERGFAVATGGYGGIMEAASRGARGAGGHVIGVTAREVFPDRAGVNPFVAEEQPAPTLGTRIALLIESTAAAIALPGSIGTAAELLVAWNSAFVTRFSIARPKPVVAVGDPWSDLVPILAERLGTDRGIVHVVASVDDAVDRVSALVQS